MSDIAQQNLKQPEQVDWDNYGSSGYAPPPVPVNGDGSARIFYGVASGILDDPDEGYLNYSFDPIKIVKSGTDADGQQIRFVRASTRPRTKKVGGVDTPIKGNPNKLADYLRAAGLQAKPQTNEQYVASVAAAAGKPFPFVADWEAYNKDTGERVKGYLSFPIDPTTGGRKSILKAGDVYYVTNYKGEVLETKTVQSDVLFANLRLRFFKDPNPRR